MEGKLLDLDETPIPIKRPIVSRDVFDADFELAEAYGAARREDKPKIAAVVEKKEDTAPPKKKIQQQLDRGDFNESRTIFKTGGFEEQASPKSYYTPFTPIGGGSGMPSPPRPTHSSISGRLRGNSSGFGSSSMTVGVTPRPLFPNNIVPGENQFDWKMSSAMTGFGCSNEDIARLPGRTRGYRGNRRGASGRGRNSEYSYKSMTGANNNSDGETNKNLTNGGAQSSPESLTTRRNRAFGVPSLTGRRASAFGEELSGLLEVPPKKPRRPSSTCTICGKLGHLAEDCYSSAVTPKTEVRCYNCNQYGHYAVRCPRSPTIKRPPGSVSRPAAWRATGGAGAAATRQCPEARGQKEKPQNKPSESEKKGLEVICKLMKDKHLREETAKTAPEVYDEMLSYMIAHVNLSPAKNTSSNHC